MKRLLHLGVHGGLGVQVAETLDHHGVRALVDGLLDRLQSHHGADHLVAARVAERLRDHVRVHAVLADEPVLATRHRRDVRAKRLRLQLVHLLDGVKVELVRSIDLDLLPVRVDELSVPQVRLRPVRRLHADLRGDLLAHLLALGVVLRLHLLDDAAAGVGHPLHRAEARLRHVVDGDGLGVGQRGLVFRPLRLVHPRLLAGQERGLDRLHGLLPADGGVGCQHPVHDLPHLAREDREILPELAAVDRVQLVADRLVDALEVRREPLEHPAQLGARSLSVEGVDLEAVRELLMERALLVERHRVPCGEPCLRRVSGDAEPLERRVQVGEQFRRCLAAGGDVGVGREEVVRQFVQERR